MSGTDEQQEGTLSYILAKKGASEDHLLRAIRRMVDVVLKDLLRLFDGLYPKTGRHWIALEKLPRILSLHALYSVGSEQLPMEQIDYNLLFCWFAGLSMDDRV